MLTFFKKIFTWWNQDTLGTKIKTILFGKLVGEDSFGNKYYQSKIIKDGLFMLMRLMQVKFLLSGIPGYILHPIKLKKNII